MSVHKTKIEYFSANESLGYLTECNKTINIRSDELVVRDDDLVTCEECIRAIHPSGGAWIVYGWDTMPYPLYIDMDELEARRYMEKVGYPTFIKFWKFGDEFGSE